MYTPQQIALGHSIDASLQVLGRLIDKGLDAIVKKRKEREEAEREALEVEKEEPKNKLPKWAGYDF